MNKNLLENTPVSYGSSAIKTISFSFGADRQCFALHWHNRMELIRVHSGKLFVGHPSNPITVSAGQMYIVPPKTPHFAATHSEDTRYDVIMFDVRTFYNESALCKDLLEMIFDGRARLDITTENRDTVDCYDRLFIAAQKGDFECISLLYRLIDLLTKYSIIGVDEHARRDFAMKQAADYIKENFSEDISIEGLAAHFGYSNEHFCRKFKQEIWLTPMNYLKICRLEYAAKLIRQKKYRMDEIARLCGFSDQNYFTRCFKAHYGVPPTKYV